MSESGAVDYSARHESFERWFQTPLGRALLADQRRFVDAELQRLTGARQLQVGISHRLATGQRARISPKKIMTTPSWQSSHIPDGVAVCDADELPFPGDSMDLVILHHTADFSPHPHQVIREAARVLRGEGTMALIGFNPLSLWGVRKAGFQKHHEGPWGGRFLLRGRMEDWLRLLGLQCWSLGYLVFQVPLQRSGTRRAPSAGLMPAVRKPFPAGGGLLLYPCQKTRACPASEAARLATEQGHDPAGHRNSGRFPWLHPAPPR